MQVRTGGLADQTKVFAMAGASCIRPPLPLQRALWLYLGKAGMGSTREDLLRPLQRVRYGQPLATPMQQCLEPGLPYWPYCAFAGLARPVPYPQEGTSAAFSSQSPMHMDEPQQRSGGGFGIALLHHVHMIPVGGNEGYEGGVYFGSDTIVVRSH